MVYTAGVLFFGTPHLGSSLASLATRLLRLGSLFTPTNIALIRHLREGSDWLRMQLSQFKDIAARLELASFYETYRTPILCTMKALVSPLPANPPPSFRRQRSTAADRTTGARAAASYHFECVRLPTTK